MAKLLDWDQVSAKTLVPVATLRTWRSKGQGPRGFRVGKHVRFWSHDVDAWLEAQYGGSTDAAA